MLSVLNALTGLTALFFIFLGLKNWKGWSFCAICVASTLTWITLVGLYILDMFDSLILIVLMAGMTLHGLYRLWEEKSSRKHLVFRLPVLLLGITVLYQVFVWQIYSELLGLLVLVWLFFLMLYFYRENDRFEAYVDDLIECCRDW